jgi:Autographiviridae endonuclease VII
MSVSEYKGVIARQFGVCAICRREPDAGRRLHVDHDHDTGRVRGLLCFTCNNALGDFEDDPGRLRAAIGYLHRFDDLEPAIRRRIDELKAMTPAWERA